MTFMNSYIIYYLEYAELIWRLQNEVCGLQVWTEVLVPSWALFRTQEWVEFRYQYIPQHLLIFTSFSTVIIYFFVPNTGFSGSNGILIHSSPLY